MSKKTNLILLAVSVGAITINVGQAHAGVFDSVGGVGGGLSALTGNNGGNETPVTSPADLESSSAKINIHLSKSLQEMLSAQSLTVGALGDKTRADELASTAKSLDGQNDLNTVSRSITISEDASKEIDSKMSSSHSIDAKAKAKLGLAVPHYGIGIVQAILLPKEYQDWLTSAQATVKSMSTNPTGILGARSLVKDVQDVTSVSAKLPGLLATWTSTTQNFIKYAQGNHVDTSDLQNKI